MNRLRRRWRGVILALLVLVLLILAGGSYYLATRAPEQLPETIGPVKVQEFVLRNSLTGPVALEQYEQAFFEKESEFDLSGRSKLGLPFTDPPILGGSVEVIQLQVWAPGDRAEDFGQGMAEIANAGGLIKEQAASQGLDIDPTLEFSLKAPSVALVSNDPSEVPEEVWMREAVSNLAITCSPSEHPWTCLLSWAQSQKSPDAQSAVLVILLNDLPLLPGQTYQIDGYARQLGMVIAAKSGFISAGLGSCFVAHEFFHGYSVKHPGQPLETFGFWGVLNVSRDDLMHQISRCSVTRESFETAGLRDADHELGIADIHDTNFHFVDLQVDETGVRGTVEDTPHQVSVFSTYQPYNFHTVTAVEVRVNGGQWKLATPIGTEWGEHWDIPFEFNFDANIDTNRLNRIEVRATTDFTQFAPTINETIFIGEGGHSVYLPLIRN